MELNNKAVGIWIRVSTEDQAKGDSPEHHEQRARLYAASKGWEVKEVYHLEALSGKSVMGYPETKRMLADIRSGAITGLIFSKLARLARNTKELLEFADIFKAEDADLISLQEAIDTSSPAGRLFYTMIAAMAQWEREEIASRVAASIPIRAKMGKRIGGLPPVGYKWENGQFLIDEKYAPVVKLTFELFLKHKRKKAVARMLNEQGFRTRKGTNFADTNVHRILRDTCSKGERRANFTKTLGPGKGSVPKPMSEWVVFACPAIVSEEIWNECNRILDESEIKLKRKGRESKNLLAGYVVCETCGKKMYVYHQKTANPAYYCKTCKTRIWVSDLDEIFHEQLKTFLLTETSISDYLQNLDSTIFEKQKLLDRVLEEKTNIKKKLDALVDMRINHGMSRELFEDYIRPIEEQYGQVTNQLPSLEAEIAFLKVQHQSSDVVLQDAKDLYSQWNTLPFEDKRTIVETITDTITVGQEDIHIKLSYLPTAKPQSPPTIPNGGTKQHIH
ncbi:MAG: hypothetical protein BGO69_08645 [Bacteroidetes bacterium 46-16]|nr:MAG: hypothetical protein BGO69_08645 [Bacteroidetes bacterium 46-16]